MAETSKKKSNVLSIILTVIIAVFSIGLASYLIYEKAIDYRSPDDTTQADDSTQREERTTASNTLDPIEVHYSATAQQLIDNLKRNDTALMEKCSQGVQFTGKVSDIDATGVTIQTENDNMGCIICYFRENQDYKSAYNKGDEVIISGKIDAIGVRHTIIFKNCSIDKEKDTSLTPLF
ncbi:MAG: hypothetical protein K5917_06165 [Clostridiales bacterium]|nr:hypothetical protein [Clostridiales bacterium]